MVALDGTATELRLKAPARRGGTRPGPDAEIPRARTMLASARSIAQHRPALGESVQAAGALLYADLHGRHHHRTAPVGSDAFRDQSRGAVSASRARRRNYTVRGPMTINGVHFLPAGMELQPMASPKYLPDPLGFSVVFGRLP